MSEELPPAPSVPRTGSMMNRIVASSLRQRFLVGLMTLLLIGVGSYSLRRLPVSVSEPVALTSRRKLAGSTSSPPIAS